MRKTLCSIANLLSIPCLATYILLQDYRLWLSGHGKWRDIREGGLNEQKKEAQKA